MTAATPGVWARVASAACWLAAQHHQGGQSGEDGVAPHRLPPGVQALLEPVAVGMALSPSAPREVESAGVDAGAQPAQHGGQQGQGGGQDGHDRQHDAQGHGPERRAGHQQDGGQRGQHGEGGEGHRLAGGGHGLRHRRHHHIPVSWCGAAAVQGGPEAHHQEQGVVDA